MSRKYQALSADGQRAKERLSPCIEKAVLLTELTEERSDIASRGFAEEQELSARIDALFADLVTARRTVGRLIHETPTLTSLERRVLRLRYLCADPWDAICVRLCRERACVFSAYRRALNKVAETMDAWDEQGEAV